MKTKSKNMLALTLCGAAITLAGCSKNESPAPVTGNEPSKPAGTVAEQVNKQVENVKAAAETVKADVSKQVDAATTAAANSAQSLIDKAKELVGSGKFEEASRSLQQLAGQSLTPEQQKLVDSLKEQIQKALASTSKVSGEAATSVGNLLKK